MKRITARAHEVVQAVVRPGDAVVDATVGNGHDTVHLARLVGVAGIVYGFDVQEAALAATRRRLEESGCSTTGVCLIHGGHETMRAHVRGPVAAVMFNLGYLPGGDHSVATDAVSTVAALEQAFALLRPGGVLCVVCYRGHPGGAEEAMAVSRWATALRGARVGTEGREAPCDGPLLVVVERERSVGG